MLGNHEPREVVRGPVHVHPPQKIPGDPCPHGDVTAFADLADVVQQRPEQQRVAIVDLLDGLAFHLVVRVVSTEQATHLRERFGEVGVDGQPVIGVALRTAADLRPGGEEPNQQAESIERIEGGDSGPPGPQDPQECVADADRPLDVLRHGRGIQPIEHRDGREPSGLRGLGEGHQDPLGRDREVGSALGPIIDKEPFEDRLAHMHDLAGVLEHRAHQGVRGGEAPAVLEPQRPGQPRLMLQVHPVRLLPRLQVQGASHPNQELLRLVRRMLDEPRRLS